jgi:hypothetical protein
MLRSFAAHNRDSLPLTLSLPSSDVAAFENRFGASPANVRLVADEEYCGFDLSSVPGWYAQQLCKLTSWRATGIDTYAVIDSDFYFINDVTAEDLTPPPGKKFLIWGSALRTVLETTRSEVLLAYIRDEWQPHPLDFPPVRSAPESDFAPLHAILALPSQAITLEERSAEIFRFFQAKQWFHYQPGPIYTSILLADFERFMLSGGLTLIDAIRIAPWENNWYGEYVAAFHSAETEFRISPVFHVAKQEAVDFAIKQGIDENLLRQKFKWVAMASRHLKALTLDGGGAASSS